MSRQDHTFAIALLLSVALHAAILLVLTTDTGAGPGAAARRASAAATSRPAPARFDFVFGDLRGSGDSSNARPGDLPMLSRDGAQQAFLSRDPVGAGQVGDVPSPSLLPRSLSASTPPPPAAAPRPVLGLGAASRAMPAPRVRRTPPARAVAERHSTAPPADPAVMSDSESDPFSAQTDPAIQFRDGRVDVRFGRKVRTVRPRLSLAAKYDLISMQFPRMVVRLNVDPRGDVRRVDIVQSTGSASADQEVKVALYQWWVEPAKSKSGVAVADTIEFPITWR